MGHAKHFLERLERTLPEEADQALELYRDPASVGLLLAECRVPDRAERIALSLRPGDEGPFAVVARDGGFVTCLGEGMEPRDLYVVSHDRFAALLPLVRRRREGLRQLSSVGGVAELMRDVNSCGAALSRERFRELAALGALMPGLLIGRGAECSMNLMEAGARLRRLQRLKPETVRRKHHAELRGIHDRVWAMTHLLLAGLDTGRLEPEFDRGQVVVTGTHCARAILFESGCFELAARAAWIAGRVGPAAVPEYKQLLRTIRWRIAPMEATLALVTIGLGHTKARAEVLKALAPRKADQRPDASTFAKFRAATCQMAEPLFPTGEHANAFCVPEIGRAFATAQACALFERALEMLCDDDGRAACTDADGSFCHDLALAAASNLNATLPGEELAGFSAMVPLLPWLARCDAEELYLPAAQLDHLIAPWEPSSTLRMLTKPSLLLTRPGEASRPEGKVGRNAPCPCGSGKKYKRCCGR